MFAFLVVIIKDRDTGSSRGFGFVTFQESKNANAAIEALHKSVSSDSSLTSVFNPLTPTPAKTGRVLYYLNSPHWPKPAAKSAS